MGAHPVFAAVAAGNLEGDPYKPLLDVVFLRPGQTVEVTGVPQEDHKIIAQKIIITDAGRVPEKEETAYGDSSQGGIDSGS